MPVKNAGNAIITNQDTLCHPRSGLLNKKKMYQTPNKIKTIPGIKGRRHKKISAAAKIMLGIKCMNKPGTIKYQGDTPSKTSNANVLMNKIKTIEIILGSQNNLPFEDE